MQLSPLAPSWRDRLAGRNLLGFAALGTGLARVAAAKVGTSLTIGGISTSFTITTTGATTYALFPLATVTNDPAASTTISVGIATLPAGTVLADTSSNTTGILSGGTATLTESAGNNLQTLLRSLQLTFTSTSVIPTSVIISLTFSYNTYDDTFYGLPNTVVPNYAQTFSSTTATFACFAQGTRIRTNHGERPVEALCVGDELPTLISGQSARIVWIGHRTIDCARHPRPWDVMPVRVRQHAFADGVPARDLLLSPDHAVHVDGALIPIRYLINDATIAQQKADRITYWHVELEAHDVILAEHLPVESYLDTGNRAAFANAAVPSLHADFTPRDQHAWATKACAPLVESGPLLERVHARLEARAGASLPEAQTLHLSGPGVFRAKLPAGKNRLHLQSQAIRPTGEHRRLGVAIARITIDGQNLALDAPDLATGFHAVEPGWRWTNGRGVLLLPPSDRPRRIEVTVALLAAGSILAA